MGVRAAIIMAFLPFTCVSGWVSSDAVPVYNRTDVFSFWNTATNNSFSVPVSFPCGADKATLSVSGVGYSATLSGITAETLDSSGMLRIDLPAADRPESENVYSLTLEFNDAAGTVRTARIGVIYGAKASGGEGFTRCVVPKGGRRWCRVSGRAVVPVPYGADDIVVDGESVDTGLGGAQGWYAMEMLASGQTVTLGLEADGVGYESEITGRNYGSVVVIH